MSLPANYSGLSKRCHGTGYLICRCMGDGCCCGFQGETECLGCPDCDWNGADPDDYPETSDAAEHDFQKEISSMPEPETILSRAREALETANAIVSWRFLSVCALACGCLCLLAEPSYATPILLMSCAAGILSLKEGAS